MLNRLNYQYVTEYLAYSQLFNFQSVTLNLILMLEIIATGTVSSTKYNYSNAISLSYYYW